MSVNQFKDTKYQELQTIQKEARNLESQINAIKFQNQKQSIVSPKDSPLIVKVNVLNQDIGFVKKEMLSKIKIDTFSFQKYGFFEGENRNKSEQFHFCRFGTVGYVLKDSRRQINVGNFSIDDEKLGAVYEVKIEPDGKTLNVEGQERYLEAGMSVTAEIKVGKRRVIEFFIYPIIRYLDEGLSVR
jgi:hemolysin D